jgi:hypothetical protein
MQREGTERAGHADGGTPLSRIDALFLTIGTLTTAGTGGIAAHTERARGMLTIQMTVDIVSVTLITGLVIARLSTRRASAALGPIPVGWWRVARCALS